MSSLVLDGLHAQLYARNQLRPFIVGEALLTVTHDLVTSRLDYCNVLSLESIFSWYRVQRHIWKCVPRKAHVTPLLCELRWLLVCFWVQFKGLLLTFKALHGMGPGSLRICLSLIMLAHTIKYGRECMLQVTSARNLHLVCLGYHLSLPWHLLYETLSHPTHWGQVSSVPLNVLEVTQNPVMLHIEPITF